MIVSNSVLVAIPTYNGEIKAELAGVLLTCSRFFGSISFTIGVSHVSLARNVVAEKFLRSPYQWLLCIDADIVPDLRDIPLMLTEEPPHEEKPENAPTKVDCALVPPIVEARYPPKETRGFADALVCAEYSYKDDSLTPVRFGLGFTRIHRSVFEKIADLKREDGEPRCWQFRHQGRLFTDYYPSGPFVSQLVPQGEWKGEDHGFFTLCALAGIIPRIETRTRLHHIGTKGFPYRPQDAGAN